MNPSIAVGGKPLAILVLAHGGEHPPMAPGEPQRSRSANAARRTGNDDCAVRAR
jgi:hypothetical protein